MRRPRQDPHLHPVWDILLPLAQTPDRRAMAFSVSSERHKLSQSLMLRARFFGPLTRLEGPCLSPADIPGQPIYLVMY